jgi:thiamine-phosphate pyrophosphorylase
MKLILMTTPNFFVEEHQILTALFDEGLDLLHLRKPGSEPIFSERLLQLLPEAYRKNIVTHEHFYLKDEYRLKGIHINHRNPDIPGKYKGH